MGEPLPSSTEQAHAIPTKPRMALGHRNRIKKEERRQQVAALMSARYSIRQIASALHVSVGTIHADKRAVLEEWRKAYAQTAHDAALWQLATLDRDERKLRQLMDQAVTLEAKLQVYDRILRVMDRRSKILGIEVPETRHQLILQNNTAVHVPQAQAPVYIVGGPDQTEEDYIATLQKGKAWLPSAQRMVETVRVHDVTVCETNGPNGTNNTT